MNPVTAEAITTIGLRVYDPDQVAAAKRANGVTVSVCLPARDEEATVGPIVDRIHRELVAGSGLVDEVLVLDDHSTDRTALVAAGAGAAVVGAGEVLTELTPGPGKGQAMWKSLFVSKGDLVVWCDADIEDFEPAFVTRLIAPLLDQSGLQMTKGFYDRADPSDRGGGRVTELAARPVLALLFPALAGLVQPLSGEYAGRRSSLEQLWFTAGYGVDLGLVIDMVARFGAEAVAQVDLGQRRHRNRTLGQLGPQALAVLHIALRRAGVAVPDRPVLARPELLELQLDATELPPVASLR